MAMTHLEALQTLLILPVESKEYQEAMILLVKAEEIEPEILQTLETLIPDFEDLGMVGQIPAEELNKLPNLFKEIPGSSQYTKLLLFVSNEISKKNISKSLIEYLMTWIIDEKSRAALPKHLTLTILKILLCHCFGKEGSQLQSDEKTLAKAREQIKAMLSQKYDTKYGENFLNADLYQLLTIMANFLNSANEQELQMGARHICETLSIPLYLEQMLMLSINGVSDPNLMQEKQSEINKAAEGSNLEGNDLVLVIGLPGHGKSTLVNILSGIEYNLQVNPHKGNEYLEPKPGQKAEPACVGHHSDSQTLYPQIVKVGKFLIADTAGFDDNRDAETAICAALCVPIIRYYAQNVRAIIIAVREEATMERALNFRSLVKTIAGIVDTRKLADVPILFAITKPKYSPTGFNTSKRQLENRLKEILESNQKPANIEILKTKHENLERFRRELDQIQWCVNWFEKKQNADLTRPEEAGFRAWFTKKLADRELLEKAKIEEQITKEVTPHRQEVPEGHIALLQSALRDVFNAPAIDDEINKKLREWKNQVERFERNISELDSEINETMGRLTIYKMIVERINDSVFFIRGYHKEGDKPDHLNALRSHLERLKKENKVVNDNVFAFDPYSSQFKNVTKWIEDSIEPINKLLKNLVNLPIAISAKDKEIRFKLKEYQEYVLELENIMTTNQVDQQSIETHISLKEKIELLEQVLEELSKLLNEKTLSELKHNFKQNIQLYRELRSDPAFVNGFGMRVEKLQEFLEELKKIEKDISGKAELIKQLENDKTVVEYASKYKIEPRTTWETMWSWAWSFEKDYTYVYPDHYMMNGKRMNVPIQSVEVSYVTRKTEAGNKIVVSKPLQPIMSGEKIDSVCLYDSEVETKTIKNIEHIIAKKEDQISGFFEVSNNSLFSISLFSGQYRSKVNVAGYVVVRPFVYKKDTPDVQQQIHKLKQEIIELQKKHDLVVKEILKNSLVINEDIQYLDLLSKGHGAQKARINRMESLLLKLGYTKESFIDEFFPAVKEHLKWLIEETNFKLLQKLTRCSEEQYVKFIVPLFKGEKIAGKRIFNTFILGENLSNNSDQKNTISNKELQKTIGKIDPTFFEKMWKLSKNMGLMMSSLHAILKSLKLAEKSNPKSILNEISLLEIDLNDLLYLLERFKSACLNEKMRIKTLYILIKILKVDQRYYTKSFLESYQVALNKELFDKTYSYENERNVADALIYQYNANDLPKKIKGTEESLFQEFGAKNLSMVSVPNDGVCMFNAIVFSELLKALPNEQEFEKMFLQLFGQKALSIKDAFKAHLLKYDGKSEFIEKLPKEFKALIDNNFRNILVEFIKIKKETYSQKIYTESDDFDGEMKRMAISRTWGSMRELAATSELLGRHIVVYHEVKGVLKVLEKFGAESSSPTQLVAVGPKGILNHFAYLIEQELIPNKAAVIAENLDDEASIDDTENVASNTQAQNPLFLPKFNGQNAFELGERKETKEDEERRKQQEQNTPTLPIIHNYLALTGTRRGDQRQDNQQAAIVIEDPASNAKTP